LWTDSRHPAEAAAGLGFIFRNNGVRENEHHTCNYSYELYVNIIIPLCVVRTVTLHERESDEVQVHAFLKQKHYGEFLEPTKL
jgi:hypothetical protein